MIWHDVKIVFTMDYAKYTQTLLETTIVNCLLTKPMLYQYVVKHGELTLEQQFAELKKKYTESEDKG